MSEQVKELILFGKTLKVLIPLILILGGGTAWSYFQTTAPVMQKATPQRQIILFAFMIDHTFNRA